MVDPLAPSLTNGAAFDGVRSATARALGRIAARRSKVDVSWSTAALDDLTAVVSDPSRQRARVEGVGEISQEPAAADGGRISDRLHWRRIPLRRRSPDEADGDRSADDAGDNADVRVGDLVLVYRDRASGQETSEGPGYMILSVVADDSGPTGPTPTREAGIPND